MDVDEVLEIIKQAMKEEENFYPDVLIQKLFSHVISKFPTEKGNIAGCWIERLIRGLRVTQIGKAMLRFEWTPELFRGLEYCFNDKAGRAFSAQETKSGDIWRNAACSMNHAANSLQQKTNE